MYFLSFLIFSFILGIIVNIILFPSCSSGFSLVLRSLGSSVSYQSRIWSSTVDNIPTSTDQNVERAVYITPKAMKYLKGLKESKVGTSYLRMGVKAGGCSGMSYSMDFITEDAITEDDYIEEFDNDIKCAIDPKSILYLYGLHLDYSDELIGGGFKFQNPNSETSCGCGKSFNV